MKELKIAAENNYKTFESMLKSIDFKEELKIATVTEVKNYLSKKKPITFKEDDDDFNENHSQDLIVLRVEYQDNDLKRLKEKIVANILKKFDVTNKDIYFWENPTEEIKKCFEYCYGYWNKKKKLLEDYIKKQLESMGQNNTEKIIEVSGDDINVINPEIVDICKLFKMTGFIRVNNVNKEKNVVTIIIPKVFLHYYK